MGLRGTLILAIALVSVIAVDYYVYEARYSLFLLRKGLPLIEALAIWR